MQLMRKALEKHQKLMRLAQDVRGCDRHLFGLQMIAKERGLDDPLLDAVFKSKAWEARSHYVLIIFQKILKFFFMSSLMTITSIYL